MTPNEIEKMMNDAKWGKTIRQIWNAINLAYSSTDDKIVAFKSYVKLLHEDTGMILKMMEN